MYLLQYLCRCVYVLTCIDLTRWFSVGNGKLYTLFGLRPESESSPEASGWIELDKSRLLFVLVAYELCGRTAWVDLSVVQFCAPKKQACLLA